MLQRAGVDVDPLQVEEASKQCSANMMTARSLVDSESGGEKWNRAVEALFGEEVVGGKLCELLAMLGYDSSSSYRCG